MSLKVCTSHFALVRPPSTTLPGDDDEIPGSAESLLVVRRHGGCPQKGSITSVTMSDKA